MSSLGLFFLVVVSIMFVIILFLFLSSQNELAKSKEQWQKALDELSSNSKLQINISDNLLTEARKESMALFTEVRMLEQKLQDTISMRDHLTALSRARESAVKTSRTVNRGYALEELAPHIQTEYDPKDFKHMGAPLDYLVIDGANDFLEGRATDIKGIVLYEVKTGSSALSKIQTLIRKAVSEGRFKFVVTHIDSGKTKVTDGKIPEKENYDAEGICKT